MCNMKKFKLFLFLFCSCLISPVLASDKYDGQYSIDYLLRNYNIVTFGTRDNRFSSNESIFFGTSTRGSVNYAFDTGGPVLIRGDYVTSSDLLWDNEFAQKTNGVPSYIKGRIGERTKVGSIESADISNIYVGSSNSVSLDDGFYTINNETLNYKYPVTVSDDYLDFDRLYASVVNEQKSIIKGNELQMMTLDLYKQYVAPNADHAPAMAAIIEEPGIYYTDDIGRFDTIYIVNYDPNELYLINCYGKYIYDLPDIHIKDNYVQPDGLSVYCGRTNSDDTCTGNIVWNMPNARYISKYSANYVSAHIIAPKADVFFPLGHYANAFIVNSLSFPRDMYNAVQYRPYNIDTKFSTPTNNRKVEEVVDDPSDFYEGSYSLDEILKNYSVVSFGLKEYDDNTPLKDLTDTKGTVSIFHIAGEYLINGNLGVQSITYPPNVEIHRLSGIRLDHIAQNIDNYSYLAGRVMSDSYYHSSSTKFIQQRYNSYNFRSVLSPLNVLYVLNDHSILNNYVVGDNVYKYYSNSRRDDYINFEKLYDSIVEQQRNIDGGTIVRPDSKNVIHIQIGGNYTIEGINEASRIIFDNFSENEDKLTIVTINDSGSINFPFEATDTYSNVFTNDFFGKTSIDYYNESIAPEVYYGNIVFNVPNASYIKFASENSFKGHIIAPNADVETPEMNFAGAMIVNSLYSSGKSEAHFYPLTVDSVGTGIKNYNVYGYNDSNKITININKTWDDDNNASGNRPDSVVVNLFADGEKIDSVTITKHDGWSYSFNDLDKYKGSELINYTVTEDAVENYSTTIDGFNIVNTYTPKKTSLTINKVWDDDNNAVGDRPANVTVKIYSDGDELTTVSLSSENNWTYVLNDIDVYKNKEKIKYTITEENPAEYYDISVTGDQEIGYTITNKYNLEKANKVAVSISDVPNTSIDFTAMILFTAFSMILIGNILFFVGEKED